MVAKIEGNFVEITWQDGEDQKTLLITPANIVKNYHALPAFERMSDEIVIIDGKHYQQMSDEQVASFVWGKAG